MSKVEDYSPGQLGGNGAPSSEEPEELIPPENFAMIEKGLYRSTQPKALSFLTPSAVTSSSRLP